MMCENLNVINNILIVAGKGLKKCEQQMSDVLSIQMEGWLVEVTDMLRNKRP